MGEDVIAELKQEARDMQLVYTTDKAPGYTREKKGTKFIYLDKNGKEITDTEELIRIQQLVIPPAWTGVWISPKANGHLQATGTDVAGRKQYKYHAKWSEGRNESKHNRMAEFAKALPGIRKKLEEDITRQGLPKEKVVAIAISVMDKTFIRVGNSSYAKLYGSYGLTSLRDKHIKISGQNMKIAFTGKKGVFQEIELTHARLSRLMKKLKDIPGQELFQYYDENGERKSIESSDINQYLRDCTGQDFTAKDFRTWWGTVSAAKALAEALPAESQADIKRNIIATLDFVAKKLGNTRTVCKKYYIHPTLISRYEEGKLDNYLGKLRLIKEKDNDVILKSEEKLMMEFIKKECA